MIEVDCYQCKSNKNELYDTENGHNLVKCLECGLLYLNPRPGLEDINEASKSGLHKGDNKSKKFGQFDEKLKETYLSRLNDFNYASMFSEKKKYSWLDIGSGHGELVETLANFGGEYIDVMGIEPNVNKLKAAIERGINLKFLDLETHQEMYDVISAIGVYSHLPNPPEDIAKWCEMLNEGGELLIQAVDSATLSLENQHKPYSLPDHFSFTSKKLLIQLLQGLGMEVIQVESYRLAQYPVFSALELLRQIGRLFLPGRSASFKFSPKYPDGDLWIRAKKRVL
ncbi:MAG: class I SAM-dependent methyltransferase [Candidatus Poseidoniaceae archaeon]